MIYARRCNVFFCYSVFFYAIEGDISEIFEFFAK